MADTSYDIYIDNGNGRELIYRPNVPDLQLTSALYEPVMGSAGTLIFNIPFKHPYRNKIYPLTTVIWLYKDGKPEWRGRYVGSSEDFNRTGIITAEGDLNYLCDSIVEPFEYKGSLDGFFTLLLNAHNAKVDDGKKLKKGLVTVTDENDYINRSSANYKTTADAFREQLINTHGGYLHIRHESNGDYLDYTYDYGGDNSQVIRFGENLIDLEKSIDASSIITCLYPVGAVIDSKEGEGVATKVDISSVNNGKKYIEDANGIAKYGRIWGQMEWEDVTLPKNLLTKAKQYLKQQLVMPQTMTLTAVDLSLINSSVDAFHIGYYTKVYSVAHDIEGTFLLQEASIDLLNPQNSRITLGGNVKSLTNALGKAKQSATDQANNAVEQARIQLKKTSELIKGGLGGYVVMNGDADGLPEEILIMDQPDKKKAQNVVRMNKNGIGFSRNGYDGDYTTAWEITGDFWADYITAGSMLADRIRGGKLMLGGDDVSNYKNGRIQVYDRNNVKIGEWNKDGLTVSKGIIQGVSVQVGGKNDKDGSLIVYDASGEVVGAMASGGIQIKKGIIQGSTIKAGGKNDKDGAIIVYDESSNVIGRWDQNGLKTLKGDITSANGFGAWLQINNGKLLGGRLIGVSGGFIDFAGTINTESGNYSALQLNSDRMILKGSNLYVGTTGYVYRGYTGNVQIGTNRTLKFINGIMVGVN